MFAATRRVLHVCWMLGIAGPVSAQADLERSVTTFPRDTRLVDDIEAETPELAARLAGSLSLDDCIQIALQRNVGLSIARQSRDAVRTEIGAAYGTFLPELTVSGTRTSQETIASSVVEDTESSSSALLTTTLPLGTKVEAGYEYSKTGADRLPAEGPRFSVTQPLLRQAGWRTSTSGVRDAYLAADAEEVALRATVLQVLFDVKSAYYEILRRRRLIDVNRQAVQRDDELVAFSRAKLEAQLATQRDVLSAEIIQAQDRARLVSAEAEYQAALDRMSNILGLRIAREIEVPDIELALAPLPLDAEAWIGKALRDNPDVQRARLDLERDDLRRDVAGNGRLPQLDVQVAYDDLRSSLAEGNVSGSQDRTRTWQGTLTLSYPLFNKTPGNNYRRARLEYEQSRRLVVELERRLTLEVRDAVRNLQRFTDRISILERNIEGARAKVEFATVNFQLGRASNLDITDAQKDLLDAETDHVNELVNYRVEVARLEQLLGGTL